MSSEFLADRRRALEDSFFARRDRELVEKLKKQMATQQWKSSVSAITGIQDEAVLDELFPAEAGPNTSWQCVAAVALIPMVEVAWADGEVQPAERKAILRAAKEQGLEENEPAYALLQEWLEENPQRKLLQTWKEYIAALSPTLSDEGRRCLREGVIGRAREVAQAAGGILGFGNKISSEEEEILQELEQALSN